MEDFLHPTHPVRCIITGTSVVSAQIESSEPYFLSSLIINIMHGYERYISFNHL